MHYIPPDSSYPTDEYKTQKMVFRKIASGKYTIGGGGLRFSSDSAYPNSVHSVNISKDYYIGIFEMTVAQYQRLANGNTSNNTKTPQQQISWNTIRGSAGSGSRPGAGILKNLNDKTKNGDGTAFVKSSNALTGFDLPTESMWEIAARAGDTNEYPGGSTTANVTKYAWVAQSNGYNHEVGTKDPNQWGLFDCLSNVWEATRDSGNSGNLATLQPDGLKPITTASSSGSTGLRGSCNWRPASDCFFAGRYLWANNNQNNNAGCRIAFIPES